MNLKTFYTFGLMLLSFWGMSQTANISGHVYFGAAEVAQPIPGYPVMVVTATGDVFDAVTDDSGFYTVEFEATITPFLDFLAIVYVFDFCTGEEQEIHLAAIPGNLTFVIDFYVCTDDDPVDPPVVCDAYFYYEQVSVQPYEVAFYDVSYSFPPTTSWMWNFGDGTTSTEPNPTHEWAETGSYEVSLTIASDSCTSTFTSIVWIDDIISCNCPEYWDPVCAVNDAGDTVTFSNICFAECEGYTDDQLFECDWVDPCNCDFIWDPVCVATPDGLIISFPNQCFAECEGYGADTYVNCGDDCNCFDLYAPVCVQTADGQIITFSNDCYAMCAGYGPDSFVNCNDCNCTDEWNPVCVATGGAILTFPNPCYAECEGYGPDSYVDCVDDCVCPDVWAPVCVATPAGGFLTFPNACYAECEGFTADMYFPCDGGCDCPENYDPVCVIMPDGQIIEFINACFAQCEGYGPDSFVDCQNDCNCPDVWDPVCVTTGGAIFTFPNACFAECEGYGPDSYVDCNWQQDCYAEFYINYDNPIGIIGLEVSFTDASYASTGEIISWAWNFGDGTISSEQNPTHLFPGEGIYEVSLEIETSEGCTSVFELHICVGNGGSYEGPDCQAIFYFDLANDVGTSFAFHDVSIGDLTYWSWDFGDGTSSSEQNPVHVYENPGVYIVTLTVGNDDCSSTVSMLVFSDPNVWYENECLALFVPFIGGDPSNDLDDNTVFFLNMSSPDAVEFQWDFGDGSTSDEFIPIHQYQAGGTYEVSLTIISASGCTNTLSATVNLDEDDFTATPQYSLTTDVEDVKEMTAIAAFPNPTSGKVNFRFELPEAGKYNIDLMSINGAKVQSTAGEGQKGSNTAVMNVETLPDGIYFARVQCHSGTTTFRIVKD